MSDEVRILHETLSAHRAMLTGALHSNPHLDIERAFQVHAGLTKILIRWDDYTAHEQRQIVRTIEYLVNAEDELDDLSDPNGFADDLVELQKLQLLLGYG